MAQITYPDKSTGDQMTGAEVTEIKTVSNENATSLLPELAVDLFQVSTVTTDGVLVLDDNGQYQATKMRAIDTVQELKINMFTSIYAIDSIFYYTQVDYDEYTLLGSARYLEPTLIKVADMPAGTTHYVTRSKIGDNPNAYVKEIKITSNEAINVGNVNTNVSKLVASEVNSVIKQTSILDNSLFAAKSIIEEATGRSMYSNQATHNVSDFCPVVLKEEYLYSGSIGQVAMYGIDYKFIGMLPYPSGSFTITNTDCYFIRVRAAATFTQIYLNSATLIGNDGIPLLYPAYKDSKNVSKSLDVKKPILGFGDSMINRGETLIKVSDKNGNAFAYKSYGGMIPDFIASQFLTSGDFDRAINIFWFGQNGGTKENIVYNFERCVAALSHSRFLLISSLTTPSNTEEDMIITANRVSELEDYLISAYGDNYIPVNRMVIDGRYNLGGVQLLASYTQPSLGSSVDIEVSNSVLFEEENTFDAALPVIPAQNKLSIGLEDVYDEYTITSIVSNPDGTGTLTATLDTANRIAEGGTVENNLVSATPAGGSETTYTQYLGIFKAADLYLKGIGIIPSSFREDTTHQNDNGGDVISELIVDRLQKFDW